MKPETDFSNTAVEGGARLSERLIVIAAALFMVLMCAVTGYALWLALSADPATRLG